MTDRRDFLKTASLGVLVMSGAPVLARAQEFSTARLGFAELPEGGLASSLLEALPGKVPLIKRSYRPPNFETPVNYFKDVLTPNEAFFVRYHIAGIPEIKAADWRLEVGGDAAATPYVLTFEQLKKDFEQVELVAICQCSGNRRGLFEPHVPGVEWGPGAMGNARWKGVRLKDVLAKAGIKKDALEIVLDGADTAALPATPDFVKSLPVSKAMDENTLIAFEMNGQPLPHWNGFPARIVVPGWTATYWMKHVISIAAVAKPFEGFWMKTAYRIPKGKFPIVERFLSQEAEANTPITEMVVNSLITTVTNGSRVRQGDTLLVGGVAWDAGYGISSVEVSADGGQSWRRADLGQDLGRYSMRPWRLPVKADQKGMMTVMAKATNRIGGTQVFDLIHNPAGYHHNVVQKIAVEVV